MTLKEQLNDLMGRSINAEFRVSAVPELTLLETDLAAARHARWTSGQKSGKQDYE